MEQKLVQTCGKILKSIFRLTEPWFVETRALEWKMCIERNGRCIWYSIYQHIGYRHSRLNWLARLPYYKVCYYPFAFVKLYKTENIGMNLDEKKWKIFASSIPELGKHTSTHASARFFLRYGRNCVYWTAVVWINRPRQKVKYLQLLFVISILSYSFTAGLLVVSIDLSNVQFLQAGRGWLCFSNSTTILGKIVLSLDVDDKNKRKIE